MTKHILLALCPFPEKRPKSLDDRAFWIRIANDYFGAIFQSRDLCFSVLMNPLDEAYWKKNYPNSYSKIDKIICLDPGRHANIICTYKMRQALYSESKHCDLINELAAEVISQYGNTPSPNLILPFSHNAPYLLTAFKYSSLLNFHEGGLSRAPFPPSWHFGSGKHLAGYDSDTSLAIVQNTCTSKTPNEFVDFIRHNSKASLDRINPFKRKLRLWRRKYRSLYLLPLQVSGEASFDALCEYENQYHFLIDVLEKTPADVGLIVTEHPWVPVITKKMNNELSCRFPNYTYEPDFSLVLNMSTYFVPYVDAVITVSSSVFWHAALMGKACCGLGTGEFSKIADTNSIHGLNELLNKGTLSPYRYDALIYRRLTQNWVPDFQMRKPDFLTEWLKYLCSEQPKPITSEDLLKQNFATATNKLKFLKRNPLNELKRFDLPLSYKSVYEKLDPTLLKVVLSVSPFAKITRFYMKKLYRILRFVFRLLKSQSKVPPA